MKLSIEAKVAAAIVIAFAVLSIGAIAQEQSEHGTGGPSRYAAPSSQMNLQESQSFLSSYSESSEKQLAAQY